MKEHEEPFCDCWRDGGSSASMKCGICFPKSEREIRYKGRVFTVTNDAKWIATDRDGDIYSYRTKPFVCSTWWDTETVCDHYLGNYDNNKEYKEWATSLEEIV